MVDTDAATFPKHNAILPLALGYTPAIHTDSLLAPHTSRSPSPGLQPLLLLHLSPRRQNHLLPLALQVRLALGAVLAPRLGLGLLLLLSRRVLPDLRSEVVSCDEIGVCGLRRSGSTSRCRGRAGRGDSERCRSLYSTPLASHPSTQHTRLLSNSSLRSLPNFRTPAWHIPYPAAARSAPSRSWQRRSPRCAAGPRRCRAGSAAGTCGQSCRSGRA
jgi:hypothetical protein